VFSSRFSRGLQRSEVQYSPYLPLEAVLQMRSFQLQDITVANLDNGTQSYIPVLSPASILNGVERGSQLSFSSHIYGWLANVLFFSFHGLGPPSCSNSELILKL
jgi:hypothetical protein